MLYLKLAVYNDYEEEVFVDFVLQVESVNGYYPDPDDENLINLLSYGQHYTVKKTHELMSHLNAKIN